MTGPLAVEVIRNGFVESVHHGRVVVLDPSGSVRAAWGDVGAPMFPRSSLKPLQTLGLLDAGWSPSDPACVALAAASHSGEQRHVDVVRIRARQHTRSAARPDGGAYRRRSGPCASELFRKARRDARDLRGFRVADERLSGSVASGTARDPRPHRAAVR
jgi:hypothetical protein